MDAEARRHFRFHSSRQNILSVRKTNVPDTDPKFVPNPTRLKKPLSAIPEPAVYPGADPDYAPDKLGSEEDAIREYAREAVPSKAGGQTFDTPLRPWGSLLLILWLGGLATVAALRQFRRNKRGRVSERDNAHTL
jgi:hypothetical protein